ncbi:hypothetical protein MLD38_012339 [Melastoma candidum]|uniref:Uncharacterized protein n=1 Tax=Melastoma candidum TaxID=119954 RepID=A0ACB9REG2_9MYRT|nr:hypothetical protein MLD38_012339 [Melastoma candidum]
MMKNSSPFLLLLISSISLALITAASTTGTVDAQPWAMASALGGGRCRGSIAECMAAGEDEMDSEVNRRILATTQYISYGALQRNTVPCSQRGASYYNCQAGAQANPYTRGCSAITLCRS